MKEESEVKKANSAEQSVVVALLPRKDNRSSFKSSIGTGTLPNGTDEVDCFTVTGKIGGVFVEIEYAGRIIEVAIMKFGEEKLAILAQDSADDGKYKFKPQIVFKAEENALKVITHQGTEINSQEETDSDNVM